MVAEICGFSLAVDDNEACYVPIGHREGGSASGGDLFAPEAKLCKDQIPEDAALKEIKALLEHPGVLKIAQNLKYDWQIFARRRIEVSPYDDTMLVSYVLDAGLGGHGLDDLAERWLNHQPIPLEQITGSGDNFLLKVRGMSMRDAGIMDGDLLAVQSTREAKNGQIVVARLGDEVTVKRFKRARDVIELHAENPDYPTIVVEPGEPFEIEGLAVGLIRNTMLM